MLRVCSMATKLITFSASALVFSSLGDRIFVSLYKIKQLSRVN